MIASLFLDGFSGMRDAAVRKNVMQMASRNLSLHRMAIQWSAMRIGARWRWRSFTTLPPRPCAVRPAAGGGVAPCGQSFGD
jgi:hypothetical protein